MNLVELQRALRQLRCSGMAAGLEPRLLQAQTEKLAPIDFLSTLVSDELLRRQDRLLDRRLKQAGFRDVGKTLDTFDFEFNKKMNRRLVFELATRPLRHPARGRPLPRPAGHRQEPSRPGHRRGRHPARPSRPLSRGPRARRRARRCPARRDAEALPRAGHHRPAPGPRRSRHEATAPHRGRGSPRDRDASLRARLDADHLEPSGGRLGQAPRRYRRRDRAARSAAPPRARPHVRPPQLAHTPSRRTQRLLNVTTSMTRRAPAQSATISEGVAIVVSPENAPCALTSERATTHPLERPPLWPVLSCRRLAGFEVSTEGETPFA